MDTFLYLFYSAAYLFLLIWGLKGISSNELKKWSSFVYFIIIALIYDNLILGIGKWIGEGDTLETLNYGRYWTHAFLTPLLTLYSVGVLRESGIEWTRKKWVSVVAILYTVGLIILELATEVVGLTLKAEEKFGVLSYVSTEEASGPPIMVLFVTAVLLAAGIILWVKTKWPVFFIGAFFMTIGSAVPMDFIDSGAITNAFELILLTSLVWTKRKLVKNEIWVK